MSEHDDNPAEGAYWFQQVAELRAQVDALTAERDEARAGFHEQAANCARANRERDEAEAEFEDAKKEWHHLSGLHDAMKARAESAEAALSVAAAQNKGLRAVVKPLAKRHGSFCGRDPRRGVSCDCGCEAARAALAPPPVADPRAEALVEALTKPEEAWVRFDEVMRQNLDHQFARIEMFDLVDILRGRAAALAAWKAR